jgi:hypothetical protein
LQKQLPTGKWQPAATQSTYLPFEYVVSDWRQVVHLRDSPCGNLLREVLKLSLQPLCALHRVVHVTSWIMLGSRQQAASRQQARHDHTGEQRAVVCRYSPHLHALPSWQLVSRRRAIRVCHRRPSRPGEVRRQQCDELHILLSNSMVLLSRLAMLHHPQQPAELRHLENMLLLLSAGPVAARPPAAAAGTAAACARDALVRPAGGSGGASSVRSTT